MAQRHTKRVEVAIPGEVIDLIEDVQTLDLILSLLEKLRDRSFIVPKENFSMSTIEAQQMLRRVGYLLSGMQRVVQENLRYEYLSGKRMAPKHRRQTLADIWNDVINN